MSAYPLLQASQEHSLDDLWTVLQEITARLSALEDARRTDETVPLAAQKMRGRAEAVRKIRQLRARCKPVTEEEILAWRDEGRP